MAILLVFGTPGGAAAADAPLLAALRRAVTASTQAAANHTCQVEVSRLQKKPSVGQNMEEQGRLEVAFLQGKEHFAWPGAAGFQADDLRDILVMGLSGSGSYAAHLRSVALSDDTVFGDPLPEASAGPDIVRIPYRVPAARSGYLVNLDGKEIEAAIRGEITFRGADAAILAFMLEAVDLPAGFPATAVTESIRYAADLVGAFRPPAEAVQRMVEAGTDEYVNRYRFVACREFRGESTVRFQDPASLASAAATAPLATQPPLPAGAPVQLRLKQDIAWGKIATGDPVEAELTRPLKFAGKLIADAGATVRGRLVEFKRILLSSSTGYFVGMRFERIDDQGKLTEVSLELDSLVDMPKGNRRGIAAMVRGETAPYQLLERTGPDGRPFAGAGFVRVLGDPTGLPAGLEMRWIAAEPTER
ncbi:MAG: hypothetical protein MUF01_04215 [Bryobacterales bacterium]|nr:hypothetical protein [Bryobacterales bacterium]